MHRVEEIRVRPLQEEVADDESVEVNSSREQVNEVRPLRRRHSQWNVDGELVNQPEVDIRY